MRRTDNWFIGGMVLVWVLCVSVLVWWSYTERKPDKAPVYMIEILLENRDAVDAYLAYIDEKGWGSALGDRARCTAMPPKKPEIHWDINPFDPPFMRQQFRWDWRGMQTGDPVELHFPDTAEPGQAPR